jgi:hypothetical protein
MGKPFRGKVMTRIFDSCGFIRQFYPASSESGVLRDKSSVIRRPPIRHAQEILQYFRAVARTELASLSRACGIKVLGVRETLRYAA